VSENIIYRFNVEEYLSKYDRALETTENEIFVDINQVFITEVSAGYYAVAFISVSGPNDTCLVIAKKETNKLMFLGVKKIENDKSNWFESPAKMNFI